MRFDIPLADWYVAPGQRVTIGAHCIDTAWPWWYPALPWEPMGAPLQTQLPLEDPEHAQGVVDRDDEV